ncbi:hypothetical protein GCM10027564_15100 [Luteimonas notoginsengisoli]
MVMSLSCATALPAIAASSGNSSRRGRRMAMAGILRATRANVKCKAGAGPHSRCGRTHTTMRQRSGADFGAAAGVADRGRAGQVAGLAADAAVDGRK